MAGATNFEVPKLLTELAKKAWENRDNAVEMEEEEELEPDYLELGWRATKGPQESNKSGFRACGHRVLLSPDEVEETTASGIVLAKKTVVAEENMAVIATVIEIGHDCWSDKTSDYCKVGDRVLVGMYCGKFHVSPVDGKKYRFVMDMDIITPIDSGDNSAKK